MSPATAAVVAERRLSEARPDRLLRPALSRRSTARWRMAGAEVMTVPAAFTRPTGEAHWEVLLRARAIETGSFVLAPAQGGLHEDGRGTWGHSIVVAPWGEVLAQA